MIKDGLEIMLMFGAEDKESTGFLSKLVDSCHVTFQHFRCTGKISFSNEVIHTRPQISRRCKPYRRLLILSYAGHSDGIGAYQTGITHIRKILDC